MTPRTLCACQPVVFMISARLAPLPRLIRPRTLAPLLSGRRVAPSFGPDVFAVFFALGAFAGLAALASFFALGAAFFLVAAFFEAGFSGATFALCAATAASWSV